MSNSKLDAEEDAIASEEGVLKSLPMATYIQSHHVSITMLLSPCFAYSP